MGLSPLHRLRSVYRVQPTARAAAFAVLGLVSLWLVLNASPAAATSAQTGPQLQIELGGHAGPVRRIDASVQRDLVVTAADDKTARVWSLSSRQLLHVLRPATAPGAIGRLYGVSLHPGKDLVAVAGSTGSGSTGHRILLFSTTTGQLIRSFDARGGDIKNLKWTPDGALLLATYAGDHGLRGFTANGDLAFEQRFTGPAYGLAVSDTGVVAASTLAGAVHLYNYSDGTLQTAGRLVGDSADPVGVSFSPDGRYLAVGYFTSRSGRDGPEIFDVASRRSLKRLSYPREHDGNLMTVAWAAQGKRLIASGTSWAGRPPRFTGYEYDLSGIADGDARLVDTHLLARDTIMDMQVAAAGELVYASFDGSWGTLDMASGAVQATGAQLSSFRGARQLLISDDARQLAFSFGHSRQPAWLDLDTRLLHQGKAPASVRPPSIPRGNTWENTRKPMINGRAIALLPDEVGRSIAAFGKIANNNDLLFGTTKALLRLNRDGMPRWRVSTPGEVQALNITADGRMAVAALSDGTMRWFDTADGTLRLSALLRQDGQWITWTPEGRFDASAGADRILGWSVNRKDAPVADFFSLNRFRARLNDPASIDAVFGVVREAPRPRSQPRPTPNAVVTPVPARNSIATRPLNFPPVVSAIDHTELSPGDPQLDLEFVVRAQGAPEIEVRIDGRPASDAEITLPSRFDGQSRGIASVRTPSSGSVIQIIARDEFGVSEPLGYRIREPVNAQVPPLESVPAVKGALTSDPRSQTISIKAIKLASIRERPLPADTPDVTTAPLGPKLFVLAIGISEYQKPGYRLGLAAKDSTDFINAVSRQQGLLYSRVVTRSITDQQATKASIEQGLKWLSDSVGATDTGMLFIAGHGVNGDDGQYYFIPWEGDHEELAQTSVPETLIRQTLGAMRGKALFFVDTCYAGNALGNLRTASRELARLANNLAATENGVVVFASSSGRQLSVEDDSWGNGAFTRAVIAGLSGKADLTNSGRITYKGLDYFVSEEVSRLTNGQQTPVTISPIGVPDFAIATVPAI